MRKTFPHYSQLDAMDCGPSCLRMIAQYYGRKYSLQTLRERCYITRMGVSMLGISDAAESIGFRTLGVKTDFEQLSRETPLPCILHWNQNHFVVLYRVKSAKKFYVADPGKGLMKYDEEDFEKHWISTQSKGEKKGIAMFFEPTQKFYRNAMEEAKERRSFHFLLGYILEYRRYFFQIFLGLLLG